MSYSKLIVLGTLAGDPQTAERNGSTVVSFNLEVHRTRGEKAITSYLRVSAWGETGAPLAEVKKGYSVLVDGNEVRFNAYLGQDGKAHATLEMTANQIISVAAQPVPGYVKFIIAGNLGADPELRYPGDGEKAVTNFSVAVNRKRGGNRVTTWVDVAAWEKLGQNVVEYTGKGDRLLVEANDLWPSPYLDDEGQPRVNLKTTAFQVVFLGGSRNDEND